MECLFLCCKQIIYLKKNRDLVETVQFLKAFFGMYSKGLICKNMYLYDIINYNQLYFQRMIFTNKPKQERILLFFKT